MPYHLYKSNQRLRDFVLKNKHKPLSIEPNSQISQQTNTLARAIKTNQSNHSVASLWSNLIKKHPGNKLPQPPVLKSNRSQTPQPKNAKAKGKSKNTKIFASNHKRKAKIVFNPRKQGAKLIKFKGAKKDRSKNLSVKKNEKGWAKAGRAKKGPSEYCYISKKGHSKGRSGDSRSPGSFRQKNFCSISKNNRKTKNHGDSKKKNREKDLKWKLKTECPQVLRKGSSSQLRNSVRTSECGDRVSKRPHKKGKKSQSKTPKASPYDSEALKITFEYLSSPKGFKKLERHGMVGTFMSNQSGRVQSPELEQAHKTQNEPKFIKKTLTTLFKPKPVVKITKNRLYAKNQKAQRLQIKVDCPAKPFRRKIKPASTKVTTKTNFFPAKKQGKRKFCEYTGDVGVAARPSKEKSLRPKKKGLGKRMYLSKNENVWVDAARKEWKGFSTCKNYIAKSTKYFGGSNLFGKRFHKEEKLVAEIVGVGKTRGLQPEEPEYGLRSSKTHRKGRKLSESLKKGKLRPKGKIVKLSRARE